jgi:hypothetical protein
MGLILRKEIGRKLTIDELDSNFQYVLENASSNDNNEGIITQNIDFEIYDILLIENENSDFTQPLTKIVNLPFTGISQSNIIERDIDADMALSFKVDKTTYLGLVDSKFILEAYYGGTEGFSDFSNPDLVDVLFNGKCICEYIITKIYTKDVNDAPDNYQLNSKLINYKIKSTSIFNFQPNTEFEVSYLYFNEFFEDNGHSIKLSENGFEGVFLGRDYPNIYKVNIDFDGNSNSIPLQIDFSNLPSSQEETNYGGLYIGDDNFIKINLEQF